jgi:hypothetical protein
MLSKTIYATLIVILTMAAASAQTDKPGLPGYTNSIRTDLEKKNDREIHLAYQSSAKKTLSVRMSTAIENSRSMFGSGAR